MDVVAEGDGTTASLPAGSYRIEGGRRPATSGSGTRPATRSCCRVSQRRSR
jgi:hypothetical protein